MQMADRLLAFAASDAGEVGVAVETPRGPVVESLMERGFAVQESRYGSKCSVHVNPMLLQIPDSPTCPATTQPALETSSLFSFPKARVPPEHIARHCASSSSA